MSAKKSPKSAAPEEQLARDLKVNELVLVKTRQGVYWPGFIHGVVRNEKSASARYDIHFFDAKQTSTSVQPRELIVFESLEQWNALQGFTGSSDKARKKLLEEHKQDDLRGALEQIDEKFQERRHAADPSLFTAQLQARGRAKVRLRAGDRVFYWDPKGVVGRLESQRECTVLEIFSDKTMANLALMSPLRVDTGELLRWDDEVLLLPQRDDSEFFKLRDMELVVGALPDDGSLQTDVDRVRESYLRNLENLKRETGVAPDDDTAFDNMLAKRKKSSGAGAGAGSGSSSQGSSQGSSSQNGRRDRNSKSSSKGAGAGSGSGSGSGNGKPASSERKQRADRSTPSSKPKPASLTGRAASSAAASSSSSLPAASPARSPRPGRSQESKAAVASAASPPRTPAAKLKPERDEDGELRLRSVSHKKSRKRKEPSSDDEADASNLSLQDMREQQQAAKRARKSAPNSDDDFVSTPARQKPKGPGTIAKDPRNLSGGGGNKAASRASDAGSAPSSSAKGSSGARNGKSGGSAKKASSSSGSASPALSKAAAAAGGRTSRSKLVSADDDDNAGAGDEDEFARIKVQRAINGLTGGSGGGSAGAGSSSSSGGGGGSSSAHATRSSPRLGALRSPAAGPSGGKGSGKGKAGGRSKRISDSDSDFHS